MINWEKVAKERLIKLNFLKNKCRYLRENAESVIKKELLMQFHAHCVGRQSYEDKLGEMAKFIAERITPYIPD